MRETVPVIDANFYSEKTPDGLFDYKLVLPTGPINGIRISVAEVKVTTTGLTYTKKTKKCTKKRRRQVREAQDHHEAHASGSPSRPAPPAASSASRRSTGTTRRPTS